MADFTSILNNFSGGKVSEKFKGRFDLQFYPNSLEEFKNFFMGKIGGAYRRTGTEFCREITISNFLDGFSIPFDSGRGDSYIVLMPKKSIRTDDTYSTTDPSITIVRLNSTFDYYTIGSGITANNPASPYPHRVISNATFTEGSWVYQQVGDILFITHTSGLQRPLALVRTSESTFELNYVDTIVTDSQNLNNILKIPYRPRNVSNITLGISGTTMTASSAFFTSGMIGSRVKIADGSGESVVVITAVGSTTSATVSYLIGASTTTATDNWQISAWSDEYGWPTSVTYHDQRLFWGGTIKDYDVVWGSLAGNLFHLMRRRLAQDASSDSSGLNFFGDPSILSDPFDFRPASTYANSTTWLSGGRVLMVGTTGGENIVRIGAEQIQSEENSNYGSFGSNVVKAGKDVIFVGKDRRTLRTYRFSDENGSWVSDDLTSKAEDIFQDGLIGSDGETFIKQISWNPDTKHLWVLLDDGGCKVLSYDPEYGLSGWSEFEIGGETNNKVVGIANLPDQDRERFITYMFVERYSNDAGFSITTLEKLDLGYSATTLNSFTSTNTRDFPRFLDGATFETADGSGVIDGERASSVGNTYDAIITTASDVSFVTGIEMIDDGSGVTGQLDYTFPANAKVVYGYSYSSELKMLPMDAGGVLGTAISDLKDISRVFLKLYRSMGFKIGSKDQRSGLDLSFETVSYDDLTTIEKEVFLFDNPDSEEQVIIRSDGPFPLNIIALIIKGDSKR